MTLKDINDYARQLLRDTNKTIFQEIEVNRAINEGVNRCRQVKELQYMKKLESTSEEPIFLPEQYHELLALFGASRCFFQDEQFQQATMLMNEFENKMFELKTAIENGDIIITDPSGNEVDNAGGRIDYIKDIYFNTSTYEM